MKKTFLYILLSTLIFALSSCSLDYPKYDGKINGYQLYKYDQFMTEIMCDRITSWDFFIKDGTDYYIVKYSGIGSCSSILYIKDSSEYITLTDALDKGILELDDILDHDWDFTIYKTYNPLEGVFIDRIEMTDEADETDKYIIDDTYEIAKLKVNWFYWEFFIKDYDYGNEQVLSYIEVFDVDGNVYHFELRTNGVLYVEEDMFCDFSDHNFHELFRQVSNP